jgi:hypothetical protein
MLKNWTLTNYGVSGLIMQTVYLLFSAVIVLPLVGCGANGDGGQMISSLATPTDATEDASSDVESGSNEVESVEQEDSMPLLPTDATADLTSEEDPTITMTPTETGVTARLTWDHSPDADVAGYYVYYGKQPSGEPGSCTPYEESYAVEAPPATITGLEPNTPYFFAISAYNESESLCSTEIMVVTPPVKA